MVGKLVQDSCRMSISRRYMSVCALQMAQQGGINNEEQEGVLVEQVAV